MLLLMLAATPFAAFVRVLAILFAAALATILPAFAAAAATMPLAALAAVLTVSAAGEGLERKNLKMLPSFRLQVDHKDLDTLTFASGLLIPCTPSGSSVFGFVLLDDMMVDSLCKSLRLFATATSSESNKSIDGFE